METGRIRSSRVPSPGQPGGGRSSLGTPKPETAWVAKCSRGRSQKILTGGLGPLEIKGPVNRVSKGPKWESGESVTEFRWLR